MCFVVALAGCDAFGPGPEKSVTEGDPGIRHKFVIGLAAVNPDARPYRKSGTWQQFHADSALVVDPGYRYIAVAMVEDEDGAEIPGTLIGATDKAVARPH